MRPSRFDWQRVAASPWAIGLGIALVLAGIAQVSLQRTFLGLGVETDFSAGHGRFAEQILEGEPLQLRHHPPGYSFVLAAARLVTDDWLDAGLWVSGLAALVCMVAAVVTYRKLAGVAAGWGTLVAFACSAPFLLYASSASSDLIFVALVYVGLALVVHVLHAPRNAWLWMACGAAAACAFLIRANGLFMAGVLALPFLVPRHEGSRARNAIAVTAGFLLPVLAWAVYAASTDSTPWPTDNHLNLAVAAYGDASGKWGEKVAEFEDTMQSTADVLAHDPWRLVSRFARNLVLLPFKAALSLTWVPLAVLAVPGLAFMLIRRRTPALLACLALIACMTMLAGILAYLSRFHLMLVPLIGAMAGVAFAYALDRLSLAQSPRVLISLAILSVAAVVGARAHARVLPKLETQAQVEFVEAASYITQQTDPGAVIVARNASLAFGSHRPALYLRDVGTASSLYQEVCKELATAQPAYLFVGEVERRYRGDLVQEIASRPVSWLEPVAEGTDSQWILYRIHLDRPCGA